MCRSSTPSMRAGAPLPRASSTRTPGGWEAAPAARVTLRYKVYANELTVRTSHLDTSHGYFNGANLFVYLDGYRQHPVGADRDAALPGLEGGHRPARATEPRWAPATAGQWRAPAS